MRNIPAPSNKNIEPAEPAATTVSKRPESPRAEGSRPLCEGERHSYSASPINLEASTTRNGGKENNRTQIQAIGVAPATNPPSKRSAPRLPPKVLLP